MIALRSGVRRAAIFLLVFAGHVGAIDQFELSSQCPPGFEKTAAGVCKLRTFYQFYDSLEDQGIGGLRTALPAVRDGFTPQQIDLGRLLFFDPLLSAAGDMSCASCHDPDKGFGDGRPRSIGANGVDVGRAAPTLWNVAFLRSFFWDARARSLEEQMQGPLFSAEEMANNPQGLLRSLNANISYRRLFGQAFPGVVAAEISLEQVYVAIAAFEASLVSLNSRYDRYAHGFHAALSQTEIEGMNVFRSFVARCAECHTPPLFTNQQIAVLGTPEPAGRPLDIGAEKTLNSPRLKAGFKVPTLRNIAVTAPYNHSGGFATLRETVAFYTGGRGHAVPAGEKLQIHWHIWDPRLSEHELDLLVEFLQALTDESFRPQVPETVPSGLTPISGPQEKKAAVATPNHSRQGAF